MAFPVWETLFLSLQVLDPTQYFQISVSLCSNLPQFLGKRPQELIDPLWPQVAQSLVHPILCWQVDLGGGIKAELWLGGSKCTVAVVQQFLGPPVKAHPVQSWASRSHLQLCTWSCAVSLSSGFWSMRVLTEGRIKHAKVANRLSGNLQGYARWVQFSSQIQNGAWTLFS